MGVGREAKGEYSRHHIGGEGPPPRHTCPTQRVANGGGGQKQLARQHVAKVRE